MTATLNCPKCQAPIEITEVMTSQLRDRLRSELDAELAPERTRLSDQAAKLAADRTALEKQSAAIDEQVRQRLDAERKKLVAEARDKATADLGVELRDRDEQLHEAQAKLKTAADQEVAWRKKEREIQAREAAFAAERDQLAQQAQQQLAAERQKLIEEGRKKAADELATQVRERDEELAGLRDRLKAANDQELALRKRQRELEEREQTLQTEREEIQEKARQQVAADRQILIEEGRRKAAGELATQVRERDEELAGLRDRLKTANEQELALRKRQRELEERAEQMQLEIDRKLDAERQQIRDAARNQAGEEFGLKLRDEQEKNETLRKQIDDLKRRAEQGSQQAQGETLELVIEEMLADAFRSDRIEEVRKGVHGADILQHVLASNGAGAGTILWEAKRAKNWASDWLRKAREDQRQAGAAVAIIVSEVLPPGVTHVETVEGVWVTSRACAIALAKSIRAGMLEAANARRALEGQHGKMEATYEYLTGVEFKNRIVGMLEPLVGMQQTLEKEKVATQRVWAAREKQIDQALGGLACVYGDLQGIIGGSLPRIEALELPESSKPNSIGALPAAVG
ncbi:MAG: hypothetical protein AMXMBFR47_36550 [Planctomycetota bacterium]